VSCSRKQRVLGWCVELTPERHQRTNHCAMPTLDWQPQIAGIYGISSGSLILHSLCISLY